MNPDRCIITLTCVHAIIVAAMGLPLENCNPREKQKYIPCGDMMCQCSNTVALCENHGRELSYIPKLPRELKYLKFRNNSLPHVSEQTLQNVTVSSIEVLSFASNGVINISETTFNGFVRMQILCMDLNENMNKTQLFKAFRSIQTRKALTIHLTYIGLAQVSNNYLSNLISLNIQKLDIRGNSLQLVKWEAFRNLSNLTVLNLSNNTISEMYTNDGHRQLVQLDISHNNIKRIPYFCSIENVSLFPSLKRLDLSENAISYLQRESFKCLGNLSILKLNRNIFRHLPDNIFSDLSNLQELQIAEISKLYAVDRYALNISSLKYLNFRGNMYDFFPGGTDLDLFKLTYNLLFIDLSRNSLRRFHDDHIMSFFGSLKSLQTLVASNTKLRYIPTDFLDSMENLTDIILDCNRIDRLPTIRTSARKKKINRLVLSSNNIRVIGKSEESLLQSVRVLNLAINPFSCTCENLWFRSQIDKYGKIGNTSLVHWPLCYKCASPKTRVTTILKDFHPIESSCYPNNYFLIIVISFVAVLSLVIVLTINGYKYRWYIRFWLYKIESNKQTVEEQPLLGNSFNAFIIYNANDSQFVHNDLRTLLEVNNPYKVHIWEREVEAGKDVFREMIAGMEASQRAVAVVSKDSLDDGWFQFQLSVALDRQLELKRAFLMLVILENVDYEQLSKFWCVLLTRLPTAHWCQDAAHVKRAVFEQQLASHLSN